jgi:CheY-like chemotaxis protein
VATILLVEDNEMNRDMLSRRLIRAGFQVTIATDGKQSIDVAETTLPDLILMDMSLPLMDGWEAVQHLRNRDATRTIPIIALTAHAMAEDRERCLAVGCNDYETKPITWPRLLEKMERLLSAHAP